MLGRSVAVVREVWRQYNATNTIITAAPPSNRKSHESRVPDTKLVLALIQNFLREKRSTRLRVVAKDVMLLLQESGQIEVGISNDRDSAACLSFVQKCLVRKNFQRGHQLDKYVKEMIVAINFTPPRQILYIDESFIHHHYTRAKDSIFDPTDTLAIDLKPKHKGRRLCFIAGIMSDDPESAHILGLHTFADGIKQTTDYHGMFNNSYFTK
ncbi:hypothetical protein THRCLA_20497 [Thraustotheca clavata]|uniref:Tc1-like transposase DDE domain-containing protein n=1 Tax=Thraustotheca clavata TaxID=74557 RepID=A0A1W0A6R5_9STRA|nr:hypothetical protein THRCLA_20497 [Thraustotheca clavata]